MHVFPHRRVSSHTLEETKLMSASDFIQALSNLPSKVSLVDAPKQWLIANIQDICHSLERLWVFSSGDWKSFVNPNFIYPRFVLYTYAHLKCTGNSAGVDVLKSNLSGWNQYDAIDLLSRHGPISSSLWKLLDRYGIYHDCKSGYLEKLLHLDIMAVAAQILMILDNHDQRESLLALRDAQAQAVLDLIQALLDFPHFDPRIRSPLMRTVVKLSKKSGLYPSSLFIRGVTRRSSGAVSGGSFGAIWQGEVNGQPVAIKVMRIYSVNEKDKFIKEFSREAVLWRQLHHPNVLPFHGVYHWDDDSSRICLISPWMSNGNILQYLKHFPDADRLPLLLDVALGLQYLHSMDPPVIHGDLKGVNILISTSRRACVADFGLGTLTCDTMLRFSMSSRAGGTLRWTAPELLSEDTDDDERVLERPGSELLPSDMYSLGCVFYEVFNGQPPFSELSEYKAVLAIMNGHKQPRPSSPELDDKMWDLMVKCWDYCPSQRPTASEVVEILTLWNSTRCTERSLPAVGWDQDVLSCLRSTLLQRPSIEQGSKSDSGICSTPSAPTKRLSEDSSLDADDTYTSVSSRAPYSEGESVMHSSTSQFVSPSIDAPGKFNSQISLRNVGSVPEGNITINVMGSTGAGKSSFLDLATKNDRIAHVSESRISRAVSFCCTSLAAAASVAQVAVPWVT